MKAIKVECNDLKCKHRWGITIDENRITGNRVMGLILCPKCHRYDAPYIFGNFDMEKEEELCGKRKKHIYQETHLQGK